MRLYRLAVLPCDGIGPEITKSCSDVLSKTADLEDFDLCFEILQAGDGAKERLGEAMPEQTISVCKEADAILKGPAGRSAIEVLSPLRKGLDLFANVRPIRSWGKRQPIDLVVVRENTEGLYSGIEWGDNSMANTVRVITAKASRRIARYAFSLAEDAIRKLFALTRQTS